MIQRKQTLFLFQLLLLGIVLMFVPCVKVTSGGSSTDISLLPVNNVQFHSTAGHWAAIVINFLAVVLSLAAVFLYRYREVQRKVCFALCGLWFVLTLMIAFCPFVESNDTALDTSVNYYAIVIGILGTLGALIAAKFIKRDIDLLKSAERIR